MHEQSLFQNEIMHRKWNIAVAHGTCAVMAMATLQVVQMSLQARVHSHMAIFISSQNRKAALNSFLLCTLMMLGLKLSPQCINSGGVVNIALMV